MQPCLITYVTVNVKHSVQHLLLDFSNQTSHTRRMLLVYLLSV